MTNYSPTPKPARRLTVREHGDTYRQRHGRQAPQSALPLAGHWLYQAGFEPGDRVHIEVRQGQIVITSEKTDGEL